MKRGDMIRIRKGTVCRRIGQDPKPAGRTFTVKVHYTTQPYEYDEKYYPARVGWAGSGGYWTECDLDKAEPV